MTKDQTLLRFVKYPVNSGFDKSTSMHFLDITFVDIEIVGRRFINNSRGNRLLKKDNFELFSDDAH